MTLRAFTSSPLKHARAAGDPDMLEAISLGWFALVGVRAGLRHRELLWVFRYEVCAFDSYLAGCVHEGNLLSFSTSESRCGLGWTRGGGNWGSPSLQPTSTTPGQSWAKLRAENSGRICPKRNGNAKLLPLLGCEIPTQRNFFSFGQNLPL